MMRPVLSREEYLRLRGSEEQQRTLAAVRAGDEGQKNRLLQMNYSCLPNDDGTLKGSTRMSTTIGMDVDHIPAEEMPAVKERILSLKDELGLRMLEKSARGAGYHLAFTRRPELSQEENLKWASELLGVAYDKGAKDITRVFFTTTADAGELLYLDDELFNVSAFQCFSSDSKESYHSKENRNLGIDGAPHLDDAAIAQSAIIPKFQDSLDNKNLSLEYNGLAFAEIVEKYWELFNGGKEPVEGDRNALTFELALTIRSICGYSLEQLMSVIPNYWNRDDDTPAQRKANEAEWRQTIENALKEPRKGMPLRLKQVLQALKAQSAVKACGGTLTTPPPMPKRLPPLIKLLTKNVPAYYKPAVASAVFPALGVHLHGVKFRYWDNVDHEPTFMNVLIGRQSIGKGSIKKPIEYIMEDIRQRDIPNREREAEWKQKNPGARQKKDPRPKDICIQMLIDNLTDAVFNQRVIDAHNNGERFIFTSVDEIEALKKVTSRSSARRLTIRWPDRSATVPTRYPASPRCAGTSTPRPHRRTPGSSSGRW